MSNIKDIKLVPAKGKGGKAELIITMEVDERISKPAMRKDGTYEKTGKSVLVASSSGIQTTGQTYTYKGKEYLLKAGINIMVDNPDFGK